MLIKNQEQEHPVIQWAHAVANKSAEATALRATVVDLYPDLRETVIHDNIRSSGYYAKDYKWASIEPALTKSAISLLDGGTIPEREVLGFAKFVRSETRNTSISKDKLYSLGITLDKIEYVGRLEFGKEFADNEDWLAALARIVWIKGSQLEAEAKQQAQTDNLAYLSKLGRDISVRDIEYIYTNTVRTIRPNAQFVPIFRDQDSESDSAISRFSQNFELRYLITLGSSYGRHLVVSDFLDLYNLFLSGQDRDEYRDLAQIYGLYICVHPHWDYNGTTTRTLVDNYLRRKKLANIDWIKEKSDWSMRKEIMRWLGRICF